MIRHFLLSLSRDVLCGKLACVWPHNNTYKSDVRSAVYSSTQGHVCITIGSSVRSGGRDYAYVADGTVCGSQMVTKHVHLSLSVLNYVIIRHYIPWWLSQSYKMDLNLVLPLISQMILKR